MNRCLACLVIPLISCTAAFAARIAPPIRAQMAPMPATIQAGQAVDIVLDRYWRSNVKVDQAGLHDNKKSFPHVPHLIEYRFELSVGGEYELQGRYTAETASPTFLTIDGKPQGIRFEKAEDRRSEWVSLSKTRLTPGKHWIRFTSRYVETPFPTVSGLRLVYHGGQNPAPDPEPPIVGPRPSLPDDWSKNISRKIHSDFHTAGFIRGIGSKLDGDAFGERIAAARQVLALELGVSRREQPRLHADLFLGFTQGGGFQALVFAHQPFGQHPAVIAGVLADGDFESARCAPVDHTAR